MTSDPFESWRRNISQIGHGDLKTLSSTFSTPRHQKPGYSGFRQHEMGSGFFSEQCRQKIVFKHHLRLDGCTGTFIRVP
ncbi:hypothetical protein PHYPO_G00125810 [Pangasianodon hypophthalmus]|uniref:Uncharacterized protein n=1 Tax=Pangasianodon hypophthalmus TaxID=310915 RepID=A0A5N5KRG6_PANHP|nr:hypothetical protein PHYPO_G00125810 [Pangasianodon hypophthalmus]